MNVSNAIRDEITTRGSVIQPKANAKDSHVDRIVVGNYPRMFQGKEKSKDESIPKSPSENHGSNDDTSPECSSQSTSIEQAFACTTRTPSSPLLEKGPP